MVDRFSGNGNLACAVVYKSPIKSEFFHWEIKNIIFPSHLHWYMWSGRYRKLSIWVKKYESRSELEWLERKLGVCWFKHSQPAILSLGFNAFIWTTADSYISIFMQSCKKLLELMTLDNHLIVRKMHQTTFTGPPAILAMLPGCSFRNSKMLYRKHFFANPMSTSLL